MRRLSEDSAHALAAEYVLGTLRGAARRRFESLARDDREVARVLGRWEDALTPLAARVAPVEPPARAWRAIEARIAPRAAAPAREAPWRALALITGGLASVLLAAFLWIAAAPREEPLFVSVLVAPDSVPRMVVSMHRPDEMRVRMVNPWKGTEGKSLELWVLPAQGKPRSLGLVPNVAGETRIRIAPGDARIQAVNALAVSLEPAGGSPTGLPTGPVLCSGAVAPLRKT